MKSLLLLIITLISLNTNKNLCNKIYREKLKIISIDKTILDKYYYIVFLNSTNRKGILVSKMEDEKCNEILIQGKEYSLELNELSSSVGITGITYRLYQYDVYNNDKLVFPQDTKVYSSASLRGICLL